MLRFLLMGLVVAGWTTHAFAQTLPPLQTQPAPSKGPTLEATVKLLQAQVYAMEKKVAVLEANDTVYRARFATGGSLEIPNLAPDEIRVAALALPAGKFAVLAQFFFLFGGGLSDVTATSPAVQWPGMPYCKLRLDGANGVPGKTEAGSTAYNISYTATAANLGAGLVLQTHGVINSIEPTALHTTIESTSPFSVGIYCNCGTKKADPLHPNKPGKCYVYPGQLLVIPASKIVDAPVK
jgi:hypothetical protein